MLDRSGDGRRALSGIRHHYGSLGLDNLTALDKWLPLMLPRAWELTTVIRTAAAQKVAHRLANRVAAGVPVAEAVQEVASRLTRRAGMDRIVSAWIVGEYATVLGYDTSDVEPLAAEPVILPIPRLPTVPVPAAPKVQPAKTRWAKDWPGASQLVRRSAVLLIAMAAVGFVLLHGPFHRGAATPPAVRLGTSALCAELTNGLDTAADDATKPLVGGDPDAMPGMSGSDMAAMGALTMTQSMTTSERDLFATEASRAADRGLSSTLSAYAGRLTTILNSATTVTDMDRQLQDLGPLATQLNTYCPDLDL